MWARTWVPRPSRNRPTCSPPSSHATCAVTIGLRPGAPSASAPRSSCAASASARTCATTRPRRTRELPDATERPALRRCAEASERVEMTPGSTPVAPITSTASAAVNSSTRESRCTGIGMTSAATRSRIQRPSALAANAAMTRGTVSNVSSRMIRAREAPSDARTASSRVRRLARTSCRLATFAQPIASTVIGAASNSAFRSHSIAFGAPGVSQVSVTAMCGLRPGTGSVAAMRLASG